MVYWRGRGRILKTKFLDYVDFFILSPSPRVELLAKYLDQELANYRWITGR
jgi:hypothetical protein